MSAHTPGPWFVHLDHPTNAAAYVRSSDADADEIAVLYGDPAAQRDADAALVAQAPTLKAENANLKALLSEALDAMRESVDGRDGRDDLQLGCPNCDGALPMPHSLGCRIAKAVGK